MLSRKIRKENGIQASGDRGIPNLIASADNMGIALPCDFLSRTASLTQIHIVLSKLRKAAISSCFLRIGKDQEARKLHAMGEGTVLIIHPRSTQIGFQVRISFERMLPVIHHLSGIALLAKETVGRKRLEGRAEVDRMVNGKNTNLFFLCLGHEITSCFYRSFICLTVRSILLWKITTSKITTAVIARRA